VYAETREGSNPSGSGFAACNRKHGSSVSKLTQHLAVRLHAFRFYTSLSLGCDSMRLRHSSAQRFDDSLLKTFPSLRERVPDSKAPYCCQSDVLLNTSHEPMSQTLAKLYPKCGKRRFLTRTHSCCCQKYGKAMHTVQVLPH